ncbi:putative membrane protein [Streptococcus pneumoniae 2070335]|nr:putative membrane protein [Streptococcus pneumoniae 2070335]
MADLSKVLDFLVLEPFLPGLADFLFFVLLEKFQHFSF